MLRRLPTRFEPRLPAAIASLAFAAASVAQTAATVDASAPAPPAGAAPQPAAAAEAGSAAAPAESQEKWRFSLAPYLWVPAMSGTVGVESRTADLNVTQRDAFDALSDLDGAFSLHFEAAYGKVSLFLDGMYANIEQDGTGPAGGSLRTELTQGLFEVGAAYRLLDMKLGEHRNVSFMLEPLGGVRVYYLDTDLAFNDIGVAVGGDETWVNVIVGARGRVGFFDDALGIFARGDYGFGADSNDAWNVIAGMDLRLASWCSLIGGYRWLNIDFEDDSAVGRFTYDVLQEGPFMAVEFRF